MPDKDPAGDGPSLELPSFGLGRKKRRDRAQASEPDVPATPDPGPGATPDAVPEVPASPDPGPEVTPGAAPDVPAAPRPDESPAGPPEIDPLLPTRPPEPEPGPEIEPHVPTAPPERPRPPEIDPLIPTRPEHEPPPHPRPTPEPSPEREPSPEPAPEPSPEPGPPRLPDPGPEPLPEPRDTPTAILPVAGDTVAAPAGASTRLQERARPDGGPGRPAVRFPSLPALPAVLLVGAVVGLTAVLLTWASLRLCDAATGTASCGGGPGLLMLLAILIALTYLGGWLLRGLGISDAGSTSFLAVGLLAVVAMLFLVDSLDEWTGAVAVVLVTVAAYALSWRVTAMLVDAGADQQ